MLKFCYMIFSHSAASQEHSCATGVMLCIRSGEVRSVYPINGDVILVDDIIFRVIFILSR